jgi:hypothetical protein
MSAPCSPSLSALPGIASLSLTIDQTNRRAEFTDKNGQLRTFHFNLGRDQNGGWLAIKGDDGSVCSFATCPPPHENLWFASGLVVCTPRCGIASHIYALARDLLRPMDAAITPSGNLFPDGVELWRKLDPSVQFEEQPSMPGYFQPA